MELEKRSDAQFRSVFEAIRQLLTPPDRERRPIDFRVEDAALRYRVRRGPRNAN